jgi:hypothetical protein
VAESVVIPSRFNGPLDSGNGGYCAGVFGALVGAPAEVSLRRPVPLERELAVVREADGSARLVDGEALIADARPAPGFDLEVPAPVSLADAHRATTRYRGLTDGPFCRCFVCGRARADAFGVFAGAVDGRALVASPWTPPAWTADSTGCVRDEFVAAVLDCPTYFGAYMDAESPISVLARLTTRFVAPVAAGEEHVVIGWGLEGDGRKRHAGSAVLSADGETLAVARALLIEPRI